MSGRSQMRSTPRGGLRADAAAARSSVPRDIGVEGGRDIPNSAFSVFLVQPGKDLDITPIVEGIEWSETSESDNINSWPSLSGTITLRQQDPTGYGFPPIEPNTTLDCYCVDEKIWRMRVVKPAYQASDGSVTLELQDEMRQLSLPRGRFRYTANKSHKNGWAPDEIAKDVCRKFKIPYKKFLVMKVNGTGARIRLAKVDRKSDSPLGVIRYAYEEARKRSAHRYLLRWNYEENKLEAVPMKESERMYEFYSSQISEATVEIENRPDFATALRVYWYKPKPRKAKKNWKPKKEQLKFKVNGRKTAVLMPEDKTVIQRYGYVERRIEFSAKSEKEARDKAVNSLAKRLRPKKSLTFTVPGEPRIRRGDFIRVNLPAQGFDRKQMWVQSVSHSVADRYTMQVTARFDNPFSPALLRKEKAAAARYKKAAEKKEKSSAGRGGGGWLRVGATVDNYSGGPVACGEQYKNNGFSYAELGVAGDNTAGGYLAKLLGVKGGSNGLPCGYKLEVRNVPTAKDPNPKVYTIWKVDNGSGQSGDPTYKIDLEPGITKALNFPGKGFVQIRKAE